MSQFWWLNPEWKERTCSVCGINIWKDGGDPDWGKCYEHFTEEVNQKKAEDL